MVIFCKLVVMTAIVIMMVMIIMILEIMKTGVNNGHDNIDRNNNGNVDNNSNNVGNDKNKNIMLKIKIYKKEEKRKIRRAPPSKTPLPLYVHISLHCK